MNDETDDPYNESDMDSYNLEIRLSLSEALESSIGRLSKGGNLSRIEKISSISFQLVYLTILFLSKNGVNDKESVSHIQRCCNDIINKETRVMRKTKDMKHA